MPAETPFPAAERSWGLLILAQRFSQIATRKCSSWGWKSCDGWRAARAHQAQQGCAGRAGWDRLRLGADGAAWKSSCRPHRSTGGIPQVPSPKKQPLRALVLASRPQTASRLGNGERLLQEPAPEPRGTKGAHPGGGCGKPRGQEGIWRLQIPLGRSQGAQPGLQPLSPDSRSTAGRARRETKFPGQWKTIEKAQQEGRWSCRCSTELPLHRGKKISAQSTRWGLIHPGGPATTNPIPGLSSCR